MPENGISSFISFRRGLCYLFQAHRAARVLGLLQLANLGRYCFST
jgi:hypothetical protein